MVQLYELPKFIQFYYFHFEIDRNVGTVFFFFNFKPTSFHRYYRTVQLLGDD
jgi:hypothetical protein